jgi:hypothetical protein
LTNWFWFETVDVEIKLDLTRKTRAILYYLSVARVPWRHHEAHEPVAD